MVDGDSKGVIHPSGSNANIYWHLQRSLLALALAVLAAAPT